MRFEDSTVFKDLAILYQHSIQTKIKILCCLIFLLGWNIRFGTWKGGVIMSVINREHKDRLFSFLFGNEKYKQWTLSLYNAVNGSSYANPDDIQLTTIGDVIYMGMKNDVSFIISDMLNIYEQQSTFNPNMPLRGLMYAGRLYDKYIHMNRKNIYGSKLVRLPVPKLVVFYNGTEEKEDDILRLSDAFIKNDNVSSSASPDSAAPQEEYDKEYDIEVKVRMININYGRNRRMMDRCRPLAEYAWLIDSIRRNGNTMNIEDAVDRAIDDMPDDYEIRTHLIANRAEVKNMCITEYNEAETMQFLKEEARKEGENKISRLMLLLLSQGLADDAKKAATDDKFRQDMYKKYNIE